MVAEITAATKRDPKDMLLELIGSPRTVNLSPVKDPWNYGEPYDSYPIETGRLRKVVELVADKGGYGRCRKATGSASPYTGALSVTSRPSSRSP